MPASDVQLLLLSCSCTEPLLSSSGSAVQFPLMEGKYSNFSVKQNSYRPFVLNAELKSSGRQRQIFSSIFPSWIVPSRLRKIFKNPVQVEQPMQDPRTFFNREKEIVELKNMLHGPPMFTVMLGPPSTGKTRLMHRVISSLRVDGT